MDEQESRKQLTLKPVEEGHIDQFNELLSYVFQVTGTDIRESGFEDKRAFIKSKQPVLELSKAFGWFHENQLISQITIYPCEVDIHDALYKMGGVTGVGTHPEYANHSLMKDLIQAALEEMHQDKQWISYLFPYNIPYCRHKSWETMSDKLSFKIRNAQLSKTVPAPGMIERLAVDHPDASDVYAWFAHQNHGALIHSAFDWEEYWHFENEEERTAAICYGANQGPLGVFFYWMADEVFRIKEMFYLNQGARNGLWNSITAHFSIVYWIKSNIYKNEPLAFLLEDSQIKKSIEPYYMAWVVNVKAFSGNFPFESTAKPFHFVVKDPVAERNNGIFGLIWDENGQMTITDEPLGIAVHLDIQTLTCLVTNYRRPSYLHRTERINTDKEALNSLGRTFPNQEAYFSDYF